MSQLSAMVLSINCPRCGNELKSRELKSGGLRCAGDCRVTLWELARESSRCWQPLTYLFVSEDSGEVKYVGTTMNLPNRLVQHAASDGKLMHGARGRQPKESGDRRDPKEKTRWREHRNVEQKLSAAGVRVHVAFDATEWHHWFGAICLLGGRLRSPAWNDATPPKHAAYRSEKDGAVVTYKPPTRYEEDSGRYLRTAYDRLGDRTASALNLEIPSGGAAEHIVCGENLCWHDRLVSSLKTDVWRTESMSGELTLSRAGAVAAQRGIGIGLPGRSGRMKSQYEDAREKLETPGGRWSKLRQGACEQCMFFGYCRCVVPCAQRWELVGEPDRRRDLRWRNRDPRAWWQDPWQRHGVMNSDDETVNDLVSEAMWLDGEMRRQKAIGETMAWHWPRINQLTKAITALRERDFYGEEKRSHTGFTTLQEASQTRYQSDRVVRRVCLECEKNFATRRELAAHSCTR